MVIYTEHLSMHELSKSLIMYSGYLLIENHSSVFCSFMICDHFALSKVKEVMQSVDLTFYKMANMHKTVRSCQIKSTVETFHFS